MRQYVYDYHGRRRLVLAHPQEPLLCVSIPADLFDEIRQWDAEALGPDLSTSGCFLYIVAS